MLKIWIDICLWLDSLDTSRLPLSSLCSWRSTAAQTRPASYTSATWWPKVCLLVPNFACTFQLCMHFLFRSPRMPLPCKAWRLCEARANIGTWGGWLTLLLTNLGEGWGKFSSSPIMETGGLPKQNGQHWLTCCLFLEILSIDLFLPTGSADDIQLCLLGSAPVPYSLYEVV